MRFGPCLLSASLSNQGPFPPQALPRFLGTTGLSATLPAQTGPHGFSVGACAPPTGLPVLLLRSSCTHAAANTPAETTGLSRSRPLAVPVAGSLPRYNGGSASASTFSRPARRSLALRPACSLNRPRRSVSPKCFSPFRYLHDPLRLLPAGTNKLPGGIRTRWSAVPWHGARCIPVYFDAIFQIRP